MFKKAYYAVMRELHLRPIIGLSVTLAVIGSYGLLVVPFKDYKHSVRGYIKNRRTPSSSAEYLDRELQFEFHSILSTDPLQLADHRLEVYKHLGTVKKYHDQLQNSQHLNTDDIADLQNKFRSAAYNVFYEFVKKNRGAFPKVDNTSVDDKKEKFYKEHNLPYPPEPITQLALPTADDIPVPDRDAPRAEFVKYYAKKYQL